MRGEVGARSTLTDTHSTSGPACDLTVRELFDELARRVGHDRDRPGWTPELVELHRHSLERRLVIIPEFYFTPVFSPAALPERVWSGVFEWSVTYDAREQLAFMEKVRRFGSELQELDVEPSAPETELRRFYWTNPEFGHGDAILYYSLLRHFQPSRVIEVGGGFSTLLSSAAAERNGRTRVTCIEPNPRPFLQRPLPAVTLEKALVQDVPVEVFEGLEENDVLFIDSSHVSKTGSDVNHLYLRVLPRLARGVWVHVHDVFLPFEYPRAWSEQRYYWNEQYLLAALLAHSRKFEIVVANYFLSRTAGAGIARFALPSKGAAAGGASFWIRAVS